jgi:hypothetical protein
VPEETAEPTPEATEAPPESEATPEAPPETGGEGEAPVAEGGTASLCVSAYHDRNTDTTLQPDNEELLPNASLTLVGTNGPAGTYTTDGISEPYCFQNLQPGNYVLRQSPPAGYTPTGPGEWGVMLGEGQIHSLQIGYVRGETAPTEGGESPADAGEDVEAEPEVEEEGGGLSNILDVVIRVSGIIVLILAVIIAGLFIVSRRA